MNSLNANIFSYSDLYLKNDIEFILTKIHECYVLMLVDYPKIKNNENHIRNILYKSYLEPVKVKSKLGLEDFFFLIEAPEVNEEFHEYGRLDIKVCSFIEYAKNEKAYYTIECKRIDGSSKFNKAYQNNGINRFVSEKYPTYKNINAMIGFVVEDIDISSNSKLIGLEEYKIISGFDYSFKSTHTTEVSFSKLSLYHLMLDYSNNII